MWYGQLTDLRKRLGEVRYGTQTGLWVRGFADKSRLDGLGGTSFTQNMFGGSIGYDTLASVARVFVACGYAASQCARSPERQRTLGRAWRPDQCRRRSVFYLGSCRRLVCGRVGTMDWYNHKLRTSMLDGTRVHDDRSSYGLGASLEAGRKLDCAFSNEGRDYWFSNLSFSFPISG